MIHDEYLTLRQAAERLGLKRQRVDQLYRGGRIDGFWDPDKHIIYVSAKSVDEYVPRSRRPLQSDVGPARPLPTARPFQTDSAVLREISERLGRLERRYDAMGTQVVALEAVADELKASARASAAASNHLVDALQASSEATDAMRRADDLRASVSRAFSVPTEAPDRLG